MVVINSFLSYLLLFLILAAIAVAGFMLGVMLRRAKNAKEASAKASEEQTDK